MITSVSVRARSAVPAGSAHAPSRTRASPCAQACDDLLVLCRPIVDKHFDKFEIYCIRNSLCVPERFGDDDVPPFPPSSHPLPPHTHTHTPHTRT